MSPFLLSTALAFVPRLIDAQDHDVRCTCDLCGLWRLAGAVPGVACFGPDPEMCRRCDRTRPLSPRGLCGECEGSRLCPLCSEHHDADRGPCPCTERPEEPSGDARETAATALADEAEDAALVAEEWQRVDAAGCLWRDPYSRRVVARDAALELMLRDTAGVR